MHQQCQFLHLNPSTTHAQAGSRRLWPPLQQWPATRVLLAAASRSQRWRSLLAAMGELWRGRGRGRAPSTCWPSLQVGAYTAGQADTLTRPCDLIVLVRSLRG